MGGHCPGNRWLRIALTEAALTATRIKDSALGARYRRIMWHRGHKKAVIAVAHTIPRTAYHLLSRQIEYHGFRVDYFDRRYTERVEHRAIQLLERQGYRVVVSNRQRKCKD